MRRVKRHLTYANVTATVALLAAIGGGTAIAISTKAPKNSVVAKSIKKGNVTASKLAAVRVDSRVGAGDVAGGITLNCQPQERLLTGGAEAHTAAGGIESLSASQPTPDGNGWNARSFGNVTVFIVCLKSAPRK
jgi:hypothetical protein